MPRGADIKQFLNSGRFMYIQSTRELAVKYNRCQEQINGKCMYPHCGCLFAADGPTDPMTGEIYPRDKK